MRISAKQGQCAPESGTGIGQKRMCINMLQINERRRHGHSAASEILNIVTIMCTFVTIMITQNETGPVHVLFSKARLAALGALFSDPAKSLHLREISRIGSIAPTALTRELDSMLSAGVIREERRGNQRIFQANPASPLFEPLRLIALAAGVAVIRAEHRAAQPSHQPMRKSERIGLSVPYDWSNSEMDDNVLIAKTLASQRFDDVAKICRTYGVARVRAIMGEQIHEEIALAILQRQLGNIESALQP